MSQHVLIVDDAVPTHALVTAFLGKLGLELEMHSAFDGESGLALAASLRPDLVLLEADLPRMSGFTVCQLLKAKEATRSIPVIFLTFGSTSKEISGFRLGPSDYLTKPLNGKELCTRVRAVLRTKWLLDLLASSTEVLENSKPQARSQPLNARISLGHLMRARAENPWNRRRSGSADVGKPSPWPQKQSSVF